MIDPQLQEEIEVALRRLKALSEDLKKDSKRALRAGANIILQEIQDRAPVGSRPHKRYGDIPKLDKRIRAPKGMGRVVATYYPGNLQKSFDLMSFRRSEAVFVGPRAGRRAIAFGHDGYYAHMVDRGTVHSRADNFIRPAVSAAEKEATDKIISILERKIKKYNKLNNKSK